MSEEAWLDISIFRCPSCGRYYADASWYAAELGSDIECGSCHSVFNTKKELKDRMMLNIKIDAQERASKVEMTKHIQLKQDS